MHPQVRKALAAFARQKGFPRTGRLHAGKHLIQRLFGRKKQNRVNCAKRGLSGYKQSDALDGKNSKRDRTSNGSILSLHIGLEPHRMEARLSALSQPSPVSAWRAP